MSDFLERMRRSSLERLDAARARVSQSAQEAKGAGRTVKMFPDLPFVVVAEIKPVSPAEGDLGMTSPEQLAEAYVAGGASVVSVLTEPTEFGGSLETLSSVSSAVAVPTLRKDFIVDEYQVWEARAHGADGVLAIARMMDPVRLEAMVRAVREAGMFVMLEVFDQADIKMISTVVEPDPSVVVGVNSRDLTTLEVRRRAHIDLAPIVPDGHRTIAESGITDVSQIGDLVSAGYDGVLVGTALVRATDPSGMIRDMIEAARVAA